MAKRIAIIMTIICVAMAAVVVQLRINTDRKAPEITFSDEELTYREGMSHAQLLEGVTAQDEEDGDVTDSLTVESVFSVDNKEAVVVYVAKDSKNNIVKKKRVLPWDGNGESEENEEPGEDIEDDQTEDLQETSSGDPEETPSPEPTPQLTEEEAAREEQEALADEMPAGSPRIYLTDYLVHVSTGTSVDRLSYVKEITDDVDEVFELWRKIQIVGDLNTSVPGTYECQYYVIDSAGNQSNVALLKFIVE